MSDNGGVPNKQSSRKYLTIGIAILATALSAWVLLDMRDHLKSDQLSAALRSIPTMKLALSIGATLLSFVTLAMMEYFGARHYLGTGVSLARASFFSFMIYGISNMFGFAGLASTPLRLRLYSSKETKTDDILSLCLLASAAFWLGLVFLLGVCLLCSALFEHGGFPLSPVWLAFAGVFVLGIATGACALLAGRGARLFGSYSLKLPGLRVVLLQCVLAAFDWLFAGLALYCLLPDSVSQQIFGFMSGFLLSQVAALVSSVPGGIGVLEGFNIAMMQAPKDSLHQLAAAFIAYRSIYYVPPLVISFFLFAAWNLRRAQTGFSRAAREVGSVGRASIPIAAATLTGLIGLELLLNSGQVFEWMLQWSFLPPFWETLLGTGMLILAVSLFERSSSARKLTLGLAATLAVLMIAFGMVWPAFFASLALIAILAVSEREFYRKSELSAIRHQQRFSTLVLLPTFASMVLGILSFYRNEMGNLQWWRFTFDSEANGFLRGSVGSLVALGAYGLWALLSPRGKPEAKITEAQASQEGRDIGAIEASQFTTAWLALVGDKEIFRVEGVEGFIMYKVARPFWVAMGEPVANGEDARKLMSAFFADCDQHGGVPVFYQTRPETLSRYVEIGFQAVKIGEEARVLLPEFSLEGRERKSMRNTCSRIEREGYKFTLVSRESVGQYLGELRTISDQWLKNLSMREKGFSIGYYNERYLSQSDIAIVQKDGRIIAFANLWVTGTRDEFSVDLMRYGSDAPSGVMEYLIIQLMLHAKSESYKWFNLGMAPLAGLEGIHSGRQWHRVGSMIYRAGEAFYNFRGLKAFKDKFGPTWESRFLVYPPGSNLARILSSVALLINFRAVRPEQDEKKAG